MKRIKPNLFNAIDFVLRVCVFIPRAILELPTYKHILILENKTNRRKCWYSKQSFQSNYQDTTDFTRSQRLQSYALTSGFKLGDNKQRIYERNTLRMGKL